MRKIEQQMIQAIKGNKAWRSGNTEVTLGNDGVSYVFLHGNLIAEVDDTSITVFDGGWQSNTTKSRLNAICNAFCIDKDLEKVRVSFKRTLIGLFISL